MAISALNCTGCGAPLKNEAGGSVLRCTYCGQTHRAAGLPAAPSLGIPSPSSSSRALVLVGVAVLVLFLAGTAAALLLGGTALPGAGASVDAEGPGDATAAYAAGEAVEVYWGSSWWPGTIKTVHGGGSYRIGYDGWASSWDEDVTPRRLRRRPAIVVTPGALGDPGATYRAGDAVDIHWGKSWWPGRVLEVREAGYHITYDGWASSWDETVDASRLRRR